MATCRVCSATLTDDPSQVDGAYGEDGSGKTLLESQVSKALGENLCTHHWMQVLEGNDNTAIASVTDNSMADTLHRHSELSASDGTPDAIVSVDSDGILYADAAPVGFDILYSGVIGAHLTVGNNIIVGGTVDGVDIAARDHTESHTVVSHSDTTATGANLNTLVGGGETALHSHAGALTLSETEVLNVCRLSQGLVCSQVEQNARTTTILPG
ncbi:hypothetical protein LCGC14_2575700 [marine sediment metagenome]|uniref:Uncharacterized protein n=1 Tax=marine sediment metagenome TaxID=412755 RepID=A0A0F9AFZ0_9ZZZZ